MVVECAEITLGVRIKTFIKKLCDNGALNFKRTGGNIHHLIKASVEILLVFCKICNSGKVNGYNADRASALAAAEETAGLLAKLTKIKAQTAAH